MPITNEEFLNNYKFIAFCFIPLFFIEIVFGFVYRNIDKICVPKTINVPIYLWLIVKGLTSFLFSVHIIFYKKTFFNKFIFIIQNCFQIIWIVIGCFLVWKECEGIIGGPPQIQFMMFISLTFGLLYFVLFKNLY